MAYLAQSPQFYKEHGVAAFERVFETGHVYRAEPHASSRHLSTSGGQRLHGRAELEAALRGRGLEPDSFASHLRMFELGMPPHGGLERLTAQILGLANVRDATLYPRDRYRVSP